MGAMWKENGYVVECVSPRPYGTSGAIVQAFKEFIQFMVEHESNEEYREFLKSFTNEKTKIMVGEIRKYEDRKLISSVIAKSPTDEYVVLANDIVIITPYPKDRYNIQFDTDVKVTDISNGLTLYNSAWVVWPSAIWIKDYITFDVSVIHVKDTVDLDEANEEDVEE